MESLSSSTSSVPMSLDASSCGVTLPYMSDAEPFSLDDSSSSVCFDLEYEAQQQVISLLSSDSDNDNNAVIVLSDEEDPAKDHGVIMSRPGKPLDCIKFFLTYPRCDVLPENALKKILCRDSFSQSVKQCVVSTEDHKDGTPHLHIFLVFHQRLRDITTSDFFDFITGQHGNYLKMRKPPHCLQYVIKSGNYVSSPGFDALQFISNGLNKKGTSSTMIAHAIQSGERDMETIIKINPGFVMLQHQKVESFITLIDRLEYQKEELLSYVNVESAGLSLYLDHIHQWIAKIPTRGIGNRTFQHLRIEGSTGIGKSTLFFELQRFFRIYYVVYNSDWMDNWDDLSYDLVVFDEFVSQKALWWINTFSDGMSFQAKRRGKSPITHKVKTPCVILSNCTWDEGYHQAAAKDSVTLEATKRRFQTLLFDGEQNLYHLIDAIRKYVAVVDMVPDASIND